MKGFSKLLLVILSMFSACSTIKKTTDATEIARLSTRKIIQQHYQKDFDRQTLTAKMTASYRGAKSNAAATIRLRIKKNEVIWMSASKLGIPFAKIKITPKGVQYYEKLQKRYFEGDFSLLSNWLGTDLNFQKVQNLLLGQAVWDLTKGRYTSAIKDGQYQLAPRKNDRLFSLLYLFDPGHFKLNRQEIRSLSTNQHFSISYANYRMIQGLAFPGSMTLIATERRRRTTVTITYRSVAFNQAVRFPFSIPKGYQKIRLD
ncbi:MAG: DUF4292 domain-containing protein [Lutibacter sp.]|jgi:hypothetical protein|nr:DUF4292 domain-containing protein [Lutibacter sp.]